MYQSATIDFDSLGEVKDGGGVEKFSEILIVFSLLHVGIGGAVYNDINTVDFHHLHDLIGIGDVKAGNAGPVYVKFGDVGEYIFVIGVFGGNAQAVAKLPVCTGYEYVHFSYWSMLKSKGELKSARRGCFVSFSERMAFAGSIHQSMPRDSS